MLRSADLGGREELRDKVDMAWFGDAFEGVRAAVGEAELRASDEVFDGVGDEHLVGLGLGLHASGDVHCDSADIVSDELALPGVEAGADLDAERSHALAD